MVALLEITDIQVSAPAHILIVEDDREISTLVARYLSQNGMRASTVRDGREMDRALRDGRFDLIVLDLNLPDEDGLSICRRLRPTMAVPIIMLTARSEDVDRIIGLEMGADDYLGKPFNPRELLARIRAVMRRQSGGQPDAAEPPGSFVFLGWTLNANNRELTNPDDVRVAVTGAEFDLLRVFCERPGRVLSRDILLDLTQGRTAAPYERSIDILISRLRQKIEREPREPELIKTIRSGGYLFTPAVERQ
ncbi:DNA-binding dual transcriptional regulator OmpR [Hyphomicrobiales bacterium]|nr:DNA-binding dual transcriptional regulator OmpR [Hyphomicrobiales bacterium]CAH1697605.1 DNA-binding dual transcriptional regulator OmpR [Hyphomicrobiales bacterium]CAI0347252.1 DNA-binding dual transcriptional regulator OmpR [Hyphomicrobiales bacterium]